MTDAALLNEPLGLEEACDEIIALKRERYELVAQAREFDELSRFWKSAAERALRLWERAQDDLDDTKTLARRAARMAEAYIESYIDEISDDEEEVLDDLGQCRIWLKQLEDECAPSS